MKIKQLFLVLSFLVVSSIALLYGISPTAFARTFLDVPHVTVDLAHILRAVMALYLGFGLFWLFAAFNDKYRNPAILTTVVFAGGLVIGRILSIVVDGRPSSILLFYTALELALIPVALLVYRMRD
ncbi:MAG: DUF4345 domain-containing protein [Planctomycetes bacterium]|nr:DUF4345 domain-containing protein [Planctomycetota bacterium]